MLIGSFQIESDCIGITQWSPSSNYKSGNINQELKIVWVYSRVYVTDGLYLTLYINQFLFRELNGSLMLVVSIWVEFKSLHFTFNHCCIANFLFLCSSRSNNIGKRVAKPSTCFFVMVSIITKTQPAKFISALTAGHVHTAWIFLNWRFAFWTLFGIQF